MEFVESLVRRVISTRTKSKKANTEMVKQTVMEEVFTRVAITILGFTKITNVLEKAPSLDQMEPCFKMGFGKITNS